MKSETVMVRRKVL